MSTSTLLHNETSEKTKLRQLRRLFHVTQRPRRPLEWNGVVFSVLRQLTNDEVLIGDIRSFSPSSMSYQAVRVRVGQLYHTKNGWVRVSRAEPLPALALVECRE